MIKVELCLTKKVGAIVITEHMCSHFIFARHGNSLTEFAALARETF